MASNVEQIINQALMAARRTKRIADIYEGTEEAKVAIELYGQTRDEVQCEQDWPFGRTTAALTKLKGPPPAGGFNPATQWSNLYPLRGFLFEYAYPPDCLELRAILPQLGPLPDTDPLPANWVIDTDQTPVVNGEEVTGPAAKVILCNVANASAVYRARIIDMTQWPPLVTLAVVERLAAKFLVAFGDDINEQREGDAKAQLADARAQTMRGG